MKKLVIGIASSEEMEARTLSIARGEHRPEHDEPTIWFTSVESLGEAIIQGGALKQELLSRMRNIRPTVTVEHHSFPGNHALDIDLRELEPPTVGGVRRYLLINDPNETAMLSRSTNVVSGMEPLVADGSTYDVEVEDDYVLMDGDVLKFEDLN